MFSYNSDNQRLHRMIKNILFFTLVAMLMASCRENIYERSTCKAVTDRYATLRQELKKETEGIKAEVGIAVITDRDDTVTINNNSRYPLMSVFKFHQALAVADFLINNDISVDSLTTLTRSDLPEGTYSPLRDEHNEKSFNISIRDLLTYTLQRSDNNACDILFARFANPEMTDSFIRSLGINDFSITETEADMHRDLNRCYLNWSSPLASSQLLKIFYDKLSRQDSRYTFIKETMENCQTGQDRLMKPLIEKGVKIGHKTGTGDKNDRGEIIGLNDIGFVSLPSGRHYFISVFIKDSKENAAISSATIARISQLTYDFMKNN